MFIKIYTIRRNLYFFLEKNFEIFFTLGCVAYISSEILKTSQLFGIFNENCFVWKVLQISTFTKNPNKRNFLLR